MFATVIVVYEGISTFAADAALPTYKSEYFQAGYRQDSGSSAWKNVGAQF